MGGWGGGNSFGLALADTQQGQVNGLDGVWESVKGLAPLQRAWRVNRGIALAFLQSGSDRRPRRYTLTSPAGCNLRGEELRSCHCQKKKKWKAEGKSMLGRKHRSDTKDEELLWNKSAAQWSKTNRDHTDTHLKHTLPHNYSLSPKQRRAPEAVKIRHVTGPSHHLFPCPLNTPSSAVVVKHAAGGRWFCPDVPKIPVRVL